MSKKIFIMLVFCMASIFVKAQIYKAQTQPRIEIRSGKEVKSSEVSIEQIKNDCKFFSTDSLSGFPLNIEIEQGVKNYNYYENLKFDLYTKELVFIKAKYKIDKFPFEIAAKLPNNPPSVVQDAGCTNIGFDNGDFSGWSLSEGHNANSNAALTIVSASVSPTVDQNGAITNCDYFGLVNSAGSDPILSLLSPSVSVASPLGGWAIRMGGPKRNLGGSSSGCSNVASGGSTNTSGEIIERTYSITPSNALFTYAYMFIYNDDGSHVYGTQPYLKVEVLDHNGDTVHCLNYYQQGLDGKSPPGYDSIERGTNANTYYTPGYRASSLNLLPYLGFDVTVRFTVAGCTLTGHEGYAYIDCSCGPLAVILPKLNCVGVNDSLISPPQDEGTFAWTGPGIVGSPTNDTIAANVTGMYHVTVTNSKGCAYTIDTSITFYPNPIITVNSPTTCAGNAVILNANSTGSAGTLAYTWNPLTNLTNIQDSTVTATVSAASQYIVTGTSVNGCTATATSTITASGAPPPTFSAPPVCFGAPTVIDNTTGGTGTFDWNFGDGTPVVTNQTSPTHTYVSTGTFVISSTVTSTGCVGTGTANAVVNPLPTATISAPPVCVGLATVFTSTITNGSTYIWDYGDPVGGSAAATATPSHTYASANTYAVTLTVTTAAPASCTVTATTSAVVSLVPTASFSVAPVCEGTSSAFDGSASTPTVGAIYTWNYGDGPAVAGSLTPTHTYGSANTFSVNLLVTVGSCSATIGGSAVVNAFPVLAFTANHPCDGAPMNITNTTTNQATISSWNWNFGDGNTDNTAAPPAHTYTAAAGFSAAGCYSVVLTATASTGCSGSHDTTVYIHPNPATSFTAFGACLGTSSNFLDGSAVQNPACLTDQIISWSYDFGDGTVMPFTAATLPVAPADSIKHIYATCGPKNITVTITTNNGCTNSATLTGDTVYCIPTVVGPIDFTVCPGAPTPVQTFTTVCANGGDPAAIWFQSLTTVNNTGAPASFLNPGGVDQVPSYNAIAQNLNCSLLMDTVFAIPVSGVGCVGNPTYYIANVWPTPTVTPVSSVTVCPLVTVNAINFTGCPGAAVGETFTWTATGDNVGLPASPNAGNIAAFAGQNSLPNSVVAASTVSVTPIANTCVGPGTTFTITVDPIPTMTVTSPAPYCPTATVSSTDYNIGTTPAVGVTYTWTATNNAGTGLPTGGTGNAPSASYPAPANPSQVDQIGIVTYTPSLNGCIGLTVTETVTIKPTPIMVAMADQSLCPGLMTNAVPLATAPTSTASTYSWICNSSVFPLPITGTSNPIQPLGPTQNPGLTTISIVASVTPTLNGCVGPPSGFNIFVYPNPIAKFSATRLVCETFPMNFTDQSLPNTGSNAVNGWAWDMGNDGSVDYSSKNPSGYVFPTGVTGSIPVTLTVTTVPSCTAVTTETVYINPNPVPDFVGDNLKSCPTLTTNFTNLSSVSTPSTTPTHTPILSYSWALGNGHTSAAFTPPQQTYTNASATQSAFFDVSLTVKTDSLCSATKTIPKYLEVYPRPIANFSWGPTDADIDNSNIIFVNEAQGASPYVPVTYGPNGVHYYLGDIYAANPNFNNHDGSNLIGDQFSHTYEHYDTATYYVTQWVINKFGCLDSITKPVHIGPNFTFYIPNAFSPNGDGTNEGFKGLGVGIDNTTYNLWVFDRWGLMIFYADDIDKSWDGHMKGNEGKPILQEDVYVWKVKFNDFTGKKHEYHGTVTLLK